MAIRVLKLQKKAAYVHMANTQVLRPLHRKPWASCILIPRAECDELCRQYHGAHQNTIDRSSVLPRTEPQKYESISKLIRYKQPYGTHTMPKCTPDPAICSKENESACTKIHTFDRDRPQGDVVFATTGIPRTWVQHDKKKLRV